jgi:hypothetical protein
VWAICRHVCVDLRGRHFDQPVHSVRNKRYLLNFHIYLHITIILVLNIARAYLKDSSVIIPASLLDQRV